MKAVKEKDQIISKGRHWYNTTYSIETVKARRDSKDILQTLRNQSFQLRILYPAKFLVTIDGERHSTIKAVLNKVYLQIKLYRMHWKKNSNLKRLITTMKTQGLNSLKPANIKSWGKH